MVWSTSMFNFPAMTSHDFSLSSLDFPSSLGGRDHLALSSLSGAGLHRRAVRGGPCFWDGCVASLCSVYSGYIPTIPDT